MDQTSWKAFTSAIDIAAAGGCYAFLVMDLTADLQAAAHTMYGTATTLVLRHGTIDTCEAVLAFALPIMTVALAIALI